MGKSTKISQEIIDEILLNVTNLSIRKLANKYNLNKNVIIRIKNNQSPNFLDNIEYLVCKKTNYIINDIKNKSGIITKHLAQLNSIIELNSIENYQKIFNIVYINPNLTNFDNYIDSLNISYCKKRIFNGLVMYSFQSVDRIIFFINNGIIINNNKIKPILFLKLKNRYDNSIFIYEDEWVNKKNIVKEKIKLILNVSTLTKLYARNCIIKEISPKIKNDFLNENHIQGTANSTISLGAYHKDILVSVMTFSNSRNMTNSKINYDYDLNRFATNINYHVLGIGGKLFHHFLKLFNSELHIVSFGDRRHLLNSNNNIYKVLNFNLSGISKHDYYYIKQGTINRIHKITMQSKYRKNKINLNESKYYEENGFKKIWDCGKYRFTYRHK